MIRAHLFISGRVQGVGFRATAVHAAARIGGLTGWVRNLDDGRVESLVEGLAENVDSLVAWCRTGPTGARVSGVEATREPATGEFTSFGIVD